MITQYIIYIENIPTHPLYADSAYRLYAHLLEQLPQEDAIWLHQTGGRGISQFLQYDKANKHYVWTINILLEDAAEILRPLLDSLEEVSIENQTFPMMEKAIREVTLESLLRQGREETGHRTTISFCTQTAFKQKERYVIFPQERLILQSLITRWNEVFPMCSMEDEDAFHAILAGIHIVEYRLRSARFLLKSARIPGFTGSCVIEAKLALPLLELWNTLLLFANYAGVGIKVGLGMGGIQTEWFRQ